jgi:hypothetical protein
MKNSLGSTKWQSRQGFQTILCLSTATWMAHKLITVKSLNLLQVKRKVLFSHTKLTSKVSIKSVFMKNVA